MEQQLPQYAPLLGDTEYFILLLCMVGVIAALFIWRQKLSGGMQFKDIFKNKGDDEIMLISQKPIDIKTRLVVFQTKDCRYIVLLGQNHALLVDKIPQTPHKDFEHVLNQESK
ncbi:MAG: hypothetical protein K2N12_01470 [Helicobacter sp.]|nr:hypothetical protein [Helicobacter sp.]